MTPALERLLAVMLASEADEQRIVASYTDFLRDFGLDHFTLGFMEGAAGADPDVLRIWTSLPDAWMEEYHARGYPAHDYVIDRLGELEGPRSFTTFDWGLHMAGDGHVADDTRPVLRGAADAGLAAAVTFAGRNIDHGRDRRFAASFGCTETPMEETARRIARHRNELAVAAFAMAPLLAAGPDPREAPPDGAPLTGRERDVLARFAQGLRPDRIAHRMGLSKRTVDMHAANARRKLGARTLAEAVAVGVRRGLI